MDDDLLISWIRAASKRWESVVTRAIAAHLRQSMAAGDDKFDAAADRLEDWLVNTLSSLCAVINASNEPGQRSESLVADCNSLLRVTPYLAELQRSTLASNAKND